MAIRLLDMGLYEPTYTHVGPDGVNTQIASARLRAHVLKHITDFEVFNVPVRRKLAQDFFRDNAISMVRVHALTKEDRREPILFCKDGTFTRDVTSGDMLPDVFLVDGHHRYARAAMDGEPMIAAWVLELGEWEEFRIVETIELTHEALRAMPVLQKEWWRRK